MHLRAQPRLIWVNRKLDCGAVYLTVQPTPYVGGLLALKPRRGGDFREEPGR